MSYDVAFFISFDQGIILNNNYIHTGHITRRNTRYTWLFEQNKFYFSIHKRPLYAA